MLAMIAFSALANPTLAALPPTGTYTVTLDSTDVQFPVWEGLCGEQPEALGMAKRSVVRLRHYNEGQSFWLDGGASLRIGSDLCPGTNRSLEVVDTPQKGPKIWRTKCASKRVVKWTEASTHTVQQDGETLTIKVTHDKNRRIRRSRCQVRMERTIILRRDVELAVGKSPDELKVGQPVVKKAKAPPKVYDAKSIEKELERELLEEARMSKGAAKIVHQNRLDEGFIPVSATYLIDGKPVRKKGDKDVPLLKPNTQITVLDDVMPAGVHTLEVKLVYRVAAGGGVYKVELSDATFFDVDEDKPLRLMINTVERGGFMSEKTESGRIEFFVNGKKLES